MYVENEFGFEDELIEIVFENIKNMDYDEAYNFLLDTYADDRGSIKGLPDQKLALENFDGNMEYFNLVFGDEIDLHYIDTIDHISTGIYNLYIAGNEEKIEEILEIAKEEDIIYYDDDEDE